MKSTNIKVINELISQEAGSFVMMHLSSTRLANEPFFSFSFFHTIHNWVQLQIGAVIL